MNKAILILGMLVAFYACGSGDDVLVGSWTQPIPGQSGVQGMKLEKGGKASSINMATLQYENWKKEGKHIILEGKSIGNGQTLSFSDTLEIVKAAPEQLVLKRGTYETTYTKAKP